MNRSHIEILWKLGEARGEENSWRIPERELKHPKVPLSGQGGLACLSPMDPLFEVHSSLTTYPIREGSNKKAFLWHPMGLLFPGIHDKAQNVL